MPLRKGRALVVIAAVLLYSTLLTLMFSERLYAQTTTVTVPAGTPIPLTIDNLISSQTSIAGSQVFATVQRDVIVNGQVVIRSGARCIGIVTNATKAGVVGSAGAISISITSVTAIDGTQVPLLHANTSAIGEDKLVTSLVVTLFCVLGLLLKGSEGMIPIDVQLIGFTVMEVQVKL